MTPAEYERKFDAERERLMLKRKPGELIDFPIIPREEIEFSSGDPCVNCGLAVPPRPELYQCSKHRHEGWCFSASNMARIDARAKVCQKVDRIDVDGCLNSKGIELLGDATKQEDGTWRCLANVGGALCLVEIKPTSGAFTEHTFSARIAAKEPGGV